jgi:hypothetical protein
MKRPSFFRFRLPLFTLIKGKALIIDSTFAANPANTVAALSNTDLSSKIYN